MDVSRRNFLGSLTAAAKAPPRAATADRVLVCVFLRGGADTLNLVVPYADDAYYRVRPSLAIPPPDGGPASAIDLDGHFGLHPALRPLAPFWADRRLAIVQSVGSDNPTGSHFEAQDQIERGELYEQPIGGGWLGRFLRASKHRPSTPFAAIGIGAALQESLRGASGASVLTSVDEMKLQAPGDVAPRMADALSALYADAGALLAEPARETLDLLARVDEIPPASDPVFAPFGDTDFARGMREVARLVRAGVGLRVACVDLNGWDTHFLQGTATGLQASVAADLANGLAAFDSALGEHRDRVHVVVMTEFGRRIYENSSGGTDHGRGFAMMLLGGGVNGGRIYGEWPGLEEDESIAGPGGLGITVDYRAVLAEIVSDFAGSRSIDAVFPGLRMRRLGLFATVA